MRQAWPRPRPRRAFAGALELLHEVPARAIYGRRGARAHPPLRGGRAAGTCCSPPRLVTTTVFFVRHGSHDRLDHVLCGRMEGVGLGEQGRKEATRAAERLKAEKIAALYVSPR